MKTKKEVEEILLENPKYSSGWINIASKLISAGQLNEELAAKYSADKLAVFDDILNESKDKEGVDKLLELLLNPALNDTQMRVIYIAFQKGVPVETLEQYADPEIPYNKTNYILSAMAEDKVDLKEYIDFSADQIYEIFAGLKDEVDYKQYAKKCIPAEEMSLYRHALAIGKTVEYDLTTKVMTIK